MGAKHSKHHDHHHNHNHHDDASQDASAGPQQKTVIQYAPLLQPKLLGFASDDAERKYRIVPPSATAALHAAVPPAATSGATKHHDSWFLIYNSHIHGSSFHRMLQLITDRGPTLIVIKDASSNRVFGGYNEVSWTTVGQREKEARSIAASNARARREGMSSQLVEGRPANQAGTYFGNEHSFVFRCKDEASSEVVRDADMDGGVSVYHARPHVNANFMYLFDAHPDEDKVGIGMGGVPPSHFGWFINRWLEEGVCRGARCTTFHNPMLSATESWHVGGVEVYAIGGDVVETLKTSEVFADGKTAMDTGASIRKGEDRVADKIILELNDQHHFYADEDARCQSESDGDR